MRALAMIWVVSHHAVMDREESSRLVHGKWRLLSVLISGDIGVDIFLALSGFLLGGALYEEYQRNGGMKFGTFYVKRWFRIAPAYIALILLAVLANQPAGSTDNCLQNSWKNLIFINNFAGDSTCLLHTWSIATEFQLYAMTPPLFSTAWLLSRRCRWSFGVAVLSLCSTVWLVCLCIRTVFALQHPPVAHELTGFVDNPDMPYSSTIYRMAPYAAGLFGGIAVKEQTRGKLGSTILRCVLTFLSALTLVFAALLGGEHMRSFLVPMGVGRAWQVALVLREILVRPFVGLATSYLLYICAIEGAPKLQSFLSAPIWTPLAGLSYSMYLLQFSGMALLMHPIYESFVEGKIAGSVGEVLAIACCMPILAILGTLPLALLSFIFVERSGIMLGQRLLRSIQSPKTLRTAPKLAEPTLKDAAAEAISDLESGSTTPTDASGGNTDLDSCTTPTDSAAEATSDLESGSMSPPGSRDPCNPVSSSMIPADATTVTSLDLQIAQSHPVSRVEVSRFTCLNGSCGP